MHTHKHMHKQTLEYTQTTTQTRAHTHAHKNRIEYFLGFAALGGNLAVIFLMSRSLVNLRGTDRRKAKLVTILILNLAISDLLVSVRSFMRIVGS